MNKQQRYKYINLLFRLLIGLGAIIFIVIKLKNSYINYEDYFTLKNVRYLLFIPTLLLMVLNWGVEAYKWKFLVKKVEYLSFFKSFKLVLSGITVGILTPNRIGEIPARVFLLSHKKKMKEMIVLTTLGAYGQALITLLMGIVGLCITRAYFIDYFLIDVFLIGLCFICLIFVFFYFKPNVFRWAFDRLPFLSKKNLLTSIDDVTMSFLYKILLISFFRYVVFFVQYYLVLMVFNINLNLDLFLISVCFLISSFVPTILLSEIGVRGSVAILVFGVISDLNGAIVLASISLWAINVAFPAIIGAFYLNQSKTSKNG